MNVTARLRDWGEQKSFQAWIDELENTEGQDSDTWIWVSKELADRAKKVYGPEEFRVRATHPADQAKDLKRRRVMTVRIPVEGVESVIERAGEVHKSAGALYREWCSPERRPPEKAYWKSAVREPERFGFFEVERRGMGVFVRVERAGGDALLLRLDADDVAYVLDGGA